MKSLYGPLLPPNLTPVDWYAFDVTATWVALELQRGDDENPVTGDSFREPGPQRRSSGPVAQDGQETVIRGTEVPPWARK
jgi:hypothetical protein